MVGFRVLDLKGSDNFIRPQLVRVLNDEAKNIIKMKALCAFLPCSGLLVQRQALPGKDLLHRRTSFSLSATPKLVRIEVWPQIPA